MSQRPQGAEMSFVQRVAGLGGRGWRAPGLTSIIEPRQPTSSTSTGASWCFRHFSRMPPGSLHGRRHVFIGADPEADPGNARQILLVKVGTPWDPWKDLMEVAENLSVWVSLLKPQQVYSSLGAATSTKISRRTEDEWMNRVNVLPTYTHRNTHHAHIIVTQQPW